MLVSGWLKAIHYSSLDLAIHRSEFLLAFFMTRSPLFPVSPPFQCFAPIDCFGDHLLECSHGSMRIHCHDTLVDIVFRALSQSHPVVLKEQRVCCEDHFCLDVVYHPDFSVAVLPILMYQFIALPSLHIFLLLLLVLGLLLQLGGGQGPEISRCCGGDRVFLFL